jgi:putative transposase
MSHPIRIFPAGTSAHIYQRALNGDHVFAEPIDFEAFLDLVRTHTSATGVDVHGFGVLNTHYHLLATPSTKDAIPNAMQRIDAGYSRYFNRKHRRRGTIWGGRYKAKVIEDERYWLTVLRYIEQNPVAAGLVRRPDDYVWTSYRVHAHGVSSWLSSHQVYDGLGGTPHERQEKYRLATAEGVPLDFELP